MKIGIAADQIESRVISAGKENIILVPAETGSEDFSFLDKKYRAFITTLEGCPGVRMSKHQLLTTPLSFLLTTAVLKPG